MSEIKPKRAAREPVRRTKPVADGSDSGRDRLGNRAEYDAGTGTGVHNRPCAGGARRAGVPRPSAPESSAERRQDRRKRRPRLPGRRSPKHSAALARGFERAAVEVTGISRSGMAATADAAVALLGARTFAEAIEINAGLARRRVDAMLEGSARLSEIGATAITDASQAISLAIWPGIGARSAAS